MTRENATKSFCRASQPDIWSIGWSIEQLQVCSHLKKEPMIKSATADTTVTNSSWNNTTTSIQMRFHNTDWYLHLKMNPIFTPRYSSWQALRSLLKHYHTPQPEISQSVSLCPNTSRGYNMNTKRRLSYNYSSCIIMVTTYLSTKEGSWNVLSKKLIHVESTSKGLWQHAHISVLRFKDWLYAQKINLISLYSQWKILISKNKKHKKKKKKCGYQPYLLPENHKREISKLQKVKAGLWVYLELDRVWNYSQFHSGSFSYN